MTLDEAFPVVNPGVKPLGGRVLLQLKRVPKKSKGGIVLVDESQATEKVQTMTAKVIALGPLAYKNRDDGTDFVEGSWCKVGDYVRAPRWDGDRFELPLEGTDDTISFLMLNDYQLWSTIDEERVLDLKAWLI
jgi:co-chaperonin GroES (HSP10)